MDSIKKSQELLHKQSCSKNSYFVSGSLCSKGASPLGFALPTQWPYFLHSKSGITVHLGSKTNYVNWSYPDNFRTVSWHPLNSNHTLLPTTFSFPTWLPPLACCVVPQPGKRSSPGRGQPAVWPARHSGRGGEWQSVGKKNKSWGESESASANPLVSYSSSHGVSQYYQISQWTEPIRLSRCLSVWV